MSVLLFVLTPVAYSQGRAGRSLKPKQGPNTNTLGNKTTDQLIKEHTRRQMNSHNNSDPYLNIETAPVFSVELIQKTVDSFSGKANITNGRKQALKDFMQKPSDSNVSITKQIIQIATNIGKVNLQKVKNSIRYVVNIKDTKASRENQPVPSNVLRAVGNHLYNSANWGAKPKATFNTFIEAYNSARILGKGQGMALEMAIAEAFKLTGKKAEAKKAEIFRLCRA